MTSLAIISVDWVWKVDWNSARAVFLRKSSAINMGTGEVDTFWGFIISLNLLIALCFSDGYLESL